MSGPSHRRRKSSGSQIHTLVEGEAASQLRQFRLTDTIVTAETDQHSNPRRTVMTVRPNSTQRRGSGRTSTSSATSVSAEKRAKRLERWRDRMAAQTEEILGCLSDEMRGEVSDCISRAAKNMTLGAGVDQLLIEELINAGKRSVQQELENLPAMATGPFKTDASLELPGDEWSIEFSITSRTEKASDEDDNDILTLTLCWEATMGGAEAGEKMELSTAHVT